MRCGTAAESDLVRYRHVWGFKRMRIYSLLHTMISKLMRTQNNAFAQSTVERPQRERMFASELETTFHVRAGVPLASTSTVVDTRMVQSVNPLLFVGGSTLDPELFRNLDTFHRGRTFHGHCNIRTISMAAQNGGQHLQR